MNPIPAAADRTLSLRKRSDLQVCQQTHQGQRWWVVKDPLSLRYFRLRDDEFAIWTMLDGSATLRSVQQEAQRLLRPRKVSIRQIESLLALFRQRELVIAAAAGQGDLLAGQRANRGRQRALAWWMNPLAIRLPGIDPEPLLRTMYPLVRWFLHSVAILGWIMLMATALLLIATQYDAFQAKLPAFGEFFRGENLFLFVAAIALSKVVHELGHALACKHFGGECHEIGPMLLVFTPALYCDTSDSWMLSSRWQRAAGGAAGMFAELSLAAVCTLIWWHTRPGELHYLCLAIMLVSSVSTLLFNANPLLRYDGYYILSDLLEIPNLAGRARAALSGLAARVFLRGRPRSEPLLPRKHRGWFAAYAVASTMYRYVVLGMIFWFLVEVLRPHGLQVIGYGLIGVALAGMAISPLRQAAAFARAPGNLRRIRSGRVNLALLIGCALAAFVLLMPLPRSAFVPAVVQPSEAERVYVRTEGTLAEVFVEPGDRVAAGDPLARVSNRKLTLRAAELVGKRRRTATRLANLQRQQANDPAAEQQLPHVEASLRDLDQQLEQVRREIGLLTLRATRAGSVIAPLLRDEAISVDELPAWSGSPLDAENLGCHLEPGDLFCLVVDPQQWHAVLAVEQGNVGELHEGEAVTVRLDQYAGDSISGRIARVARNKISPSDETSPRDPLLAEATDAWQQADGTPPPYLAHVTLETGDETLLTGFAGEARVRLTNRSLGWRLWRYAIETFRF